VVFDFEVGSQQREGLPVNVVNDRRGKQNSTDPPAKI
jgi:hypothetical protein